MTDNFIAELKNYISREKEYSGNAWCDPDDVQAAIDEIEKLRALLIEAKDEIEFWVDGHRCCDGNAEEVIEKINNTLNLKDSE